LFTVDGVVSRRPDVQIDNGIMRLSDTVDNLDRGSGLLGEKPLGANVVKGGWGLTGGTAWEKRCGGIC
jgi:hypothetical protein